MGILLNCRRKSGEFLALLVTRYSLLLSIPTLRWLRACAAFGSVGLGRNDEGPASLLGTRDSLLLEKASTVSPSFYWFCSSLSGPEGVNLMIRGCRQVFRVTEVKKR